MATLVEQKNILVHFATATNVFQWVVSWELNDPITTWIGVELDSSLENVIGINLPSNQLVGTIPSSFGGLTTLQYLNLPRNSLGGQLPTSICYLQQLTNLDLHSNAFTGPLMPCLSNLQHLQVMSLHHNKFDSLIPSELGLMHGLKYMLLDSNKFTGTIPGGFGNFTNLLYATLHGNKLGGQMPLELCRIPLITYFSMDTGICYQNCMYRALNAALNSTQVAQLQRCQGIEDFTLCVLLRNTNIRTALTGGSNTTVPKVIDISQPLIGTEVTPIAITVRYQQSSAIETDISFDYFTDMVPRTFVIKSIVTGDVLADLSGRDIENMPGVGANPILRIYERLFTVTYKFDDCYQHINFGNPCFGYSVSIVTQAAITGWSCTSPPKDTAYTTKGDPFWNTLGITYGASYAGATDGSWSNDYCGWYGVECFHRRIVGINLNQFGITGTIPDYFANLVTLQTLDVSSNNFNGNIPPSLSHFTSLRKLDLSGNGFNSTIPSEIGQMTQLQSLDLHNNHLSGPVPVWLFNQLNQSTSSVDLAANEFSGPIETDICPVSIHMRIDLTVNLFSCYEQCPSDQVYDTISYGSLGICGPTASPTSAPISAANTGTFFSKDELFFMLILVLGIALVLSCCVYMVYRRYYRKTSYSEFFDMEERRHALKKLPIHQAIANNESGSDILQLIMHFSDTINLKDFDGLTAFDWMVKNENAVPDEEQRFEILVLLVQLTLPFSPQSKAPVDPDVHGYLWCKIVQTDKNVELVRAVCDMYPQLAFELAYAVDEENRPVINIASPMCQKVVLQSVYFMKRYEIQGHWDTPHHKSDTCIVIIAKDHEDNERKVALKLMRFKSQYLNEVDVRKRGNFNENFVVSILRVHDGDVDESYAWHVRSRGIAEYFYCIVMPAADRDLNVIIANERLAGKDWLQVKLISMQLSETIAHVHKKGYIHGDLKPLNIMRVDNRIKLIDFDASAPIGIGYSGHKFSTGYVPPELVHRSVDGRYVIKSFNIDEDSSRPLSGHLPYQLIVAAPSHDMWSLGIVLYELCSGIKMFLSNYDDNIEEEDLEVLHTFSDDFKRKKLFKISDLQARNLISQLLHRDPKRRPTIESVLAHPFLSGGKAPRMIGERAEFDVFISYRVIAESEIALKLYEQLSKAGLKVWIDQKCLKPGVSWESGFVEGLIKSRIFLPILSRNSINNSSNDRCNFTKLNSDSLVDNLLLEYRLALEFHERDLIRLIYPIMIGDLHLAADANNNNTIGNGALNTSTCIDGKDTYTNYLLDGSHPEFHDDFIVSSVEMLSEEYLNQLCLGSPLCVDMTVSKILKEFTSKQGKLVTGVAEDAFEGVVEDVTAMMRSLTSRASFFKAPSHRPQSTSITSPPSPLLRNSPASQVIKASMLSQQNKDLNYLNNSNSFNNGNSSSKTTASTNTTSSTATTPTTTMMPLSMEITSKQ